METTMTSEITSDFIATARSVLFGLTGAACLAYGVLAVGMGRPDPIPFWIPGAFGMLSAIVLTLSSMAAGERRADQAWDEGYMADTRRAASLAFWSVMVLFPLSGVGMAIGLIEISTAFAAVGSLSAAVYLLLMTWFDLRARG
jgi:hypothetical protein